MPTPSLQPQDRHEAVLASAPGHVSFLQSPQWAAVKNGWDAHRLVWAGDAGCALVLARSVPVVPWSFHYCPEGPVLDWSDPVAAADRLDELAARARELGGFALRVGPPVVRRRWTSATVKTGLADPGRRRLQDLPADETHPGAEGLVELLRARGWRPRLTEDGFGAGQPHVLAQVRLAGADRAALLAGMNQGWRRNLRRAEAAGVVCAEEDASSVAEVHRVYVETAHRDGFTPRPPTYFTTLLGALDGAGPATARLLTARRRDGALLAAAVVVVLGNTWTYLYGASTTAHRDERGANAVQWFAMQQACAAGAARYDMRGVTTTLDPEDPHAGLLRFKVSAGAEVVETVGEWERPLRTAAHLGFRAYLRARTRARGLRRR